MSEKENKNLERHITWRDKTREQLSFFNNLLLTVSVGFLSYSFTKINLSHFYFVFDNWQPLSSIMKIQLKPTMLSMSLIIISLSIIFGLLVAIIRLYDFRITAQIVQIRSWVKEKLPTQTHKYGFWLKFILIFKVIFGKYRKIEYRNCVKFEFMSKTERRVFTKDFRNLRCIAHNLGSLTWSNLNCQILCFFIGILFFVVAQF